MSKFYRRDEYWNDRGHDKKPFTVIYRIHFKARAANLIRYGDIDALKITYSGPRWSFSIQRRYPHA
jgi:hypothetical protein